MRKQNKAGLCLYFFSNHPDPMFDDDDEDDEDGFLPGYDM